MMECVTWSFLPRRHAELFGAGETPLLLANPISSELDAMRPSLVANLLTAVGRNLARGFEDVALFEVGGQFADTTPTGEAAMASGVRRGRGWGRHWSGKAARSMRSTPRPTRWPSWQRSAHRFDPCRSCARRRAGTTRAAPPP